MSDYVIDDNYLVCPHCGHKYTPPKNMDEDDEYASQCKYCGTWFMFHPKYEISYYTDDEVDPKDYIIMDLD